MKDTIMLTAVCVCHQVPAYRETDHKQPYWVCEIDDKICGVEFREDNNEQPEGLFEEGKI